MIKKKLPEPHETQEKLIKKIHVMFNAGQYIDQQKKDMNNFYINNFSVSENIIFSNLDLTEIF